MEIISIENLTFTYPKTQNATLSDVSLNISEGEFVTVCGPTGSGKSTLLRLMKKELMPNGTLKGKIFVDGEEITNSAAHSSAFTVGFVAQRCEEQLITDKVWHELSFGLENLNLPKSEIERRITEVCAFFGIEDWYEKSTAELSGGQKQLLNLAAVTAMRPKVIILDEPTSQLDPISAVSFLDMLTRLNRELAITVIIAEHRLEELYFRSDKVLFLQNHGVTIFDTPQKVAEKMASDNSLLPFLPSVTQLFYLTGGKNNCPFSVTEGRRYVTENFKNEVQTFPTENPKAEKDVALSFKDVCFKYEKNRKNILDNMTFSVNRGEIFCLLGSCGTGKTTALLNMAGVLSPYRGKIEIFGKNIKSYKGLSLYNNCLAMLPQDVQNLFSKNTVAEELAKTDNTAIDLRELEKMHPYDLSGGEQQKLALNIVFASNPRILLLDEPTKAIDNFAKKELCALLKEFKNNGGTVVAVTHDAEFAAMVSDRCAFCFNGKINSCDNVRTFFSENNFFTTSISRTTKGYYKNVVSLKDALEIINRNGRKTNGSNK